MATKNAACPGAPIRYRKRCVGQTFILAAQTNGYFVLNDIFRYIVDEEDEANDADDVPQEQQQASAIEAGVQEPAPTVQPGASEPEGLEVVEEVPQEVQRIRGSVFIFGSDRYRY